MTGPAAQDGAGRPGRRAFLAGVGAAALARGLGLAVAPDLAGPRSASAQALALARSAVVGVLGPPAPTEPGRTGAALIRETLAELGWKEGLRVEERFAADLRQPLGALAAELGRLGAEVIVALGPEAAMAAAPQSRTIPVVMVGVGDPVAVGLVPMPPAPRGQMAIIELPTADLMERRLALLREAVPAARRIGILFLRSPRTGVSVRHAEAAARRLGLSAPRVTLRPPFKPEDLAAELQRSRADAVLGVSNPALDARRQEVAEVLQAGRLPAVLDAGGWADAGALLSYAPEPAALVRQAAILVDRVLKGEAAADLPVEAAARFDLVVNRKAAAALGLTLPPALLARATRVVE